MVWDGRQGWSGAGVGSMGGEGWQPSAAGSHVIQRGEGAELRGQAAAQAVAVKGPASERGTSGGVRGVRGTG